MSSRSTIKVDPQFLANLATRIRRVSTDLRQYSSHAACNLDSAPPVANAYRDLGGRWDHNRGRLADTLDELAEAFRSARQAFMDADREMAEQLEH